MYTYAAKYSQKTKVWIKLQLSDTKTFYQVGRCVHVTLMSFANCYSNEADD